LFLPARDPAEEVWIGRRLDPKNPASKEETGFEAIEEIDSLETELQRYTKQHQTVYTILPSPHASEEQRALEKDRLERLRKMIPSAQMKDIRGAMAELREVKTSAELAQIRRAVNCTIEGLHAAARDLRPGRMEYETAALMKYTFERMGCTVTGFHPIVGSGPRSVILHYTRNSGRMESGDVVVLDVGAEYGDYSADISRTLPVNGRFTPRQRELYEIVLGAQKAVIQAVKPGARLYGHGANSLYQIAYDYLNSHGKDRDGKPLGKYFNHGLGHSVGLDVHDPMNRSGQLEAGMVIAIEPGLYLPDENIGIRIEDMVLVTESGYELLTERLPREVEEIERLTQE
jgi:Xaa-Pro aminopeptidase